MKTHVKNIEEPEEINDTYILDTFSKKNGAFNYKKIHIYTKSKLYLLHRFDDISNTDLILLESFYRIKHNIQTRPICKICGKPLVFNNKFTAACSNECKNKLLSIRCSTRWKDPIFKLKTIANIENTMIKKYGVKSNFLLKTHQQKVLEAIFKKYGIHATTTFQVPEVREKWKQNNLAKYGVEYVQSTDNVRLKISSALSSKESQEKMRQTCLLKYGYEYVSQVPEIQDKILESYKKSKIYKSSIQENMLLDILKEEFSDIQHLYKSKEYPFICDFYIPQLKLYIELNSSQYHTSKIFENSEEDKLYLEYIKEKDEKFYNMLYDTWVIRDTHKRNVAITNKLNYLCLYNKFHKNWLKYCYYNAHNDNLKQNIKEFLINFIYNNYNDKSCNYLCIGQSKIIFNNHENNN